MRKIKKITPIKSATLCTEKCKFKFARYCINKNCGACERYTNRLCLCLKISTGQPCPYFERFVEEGADK